MSGIEKHNSCIGVRGLYVECFRPTTASRFVLSGMSFYEVTSILGHTNISTTIKFSHLANDQVTQKAEPARTIFLSLAHLGQRWARLSDPQSMWLKESDK